MALCGGCARSEDDIRRDVRARLDADQSLAPLALSIEVKRQVVYLSGMTPTMDEQQRAVTVANDVRWREDGGKAEGLGGLDADEIFAGDRIVQPVGRAGEAGAGKAIQDSLKREGVSQ